MQQLHLIFRVDEQDQVSTQVSSFISLACMLAVAVVAANCCPKMRSQRGGKVDESGFLYSAPTDLLLAILSAWPPTKYALCLCLATLLVSCLTSSVAGQHLSNAEKQWREDAVFAVHISGPRLTPAEVLDHLEHLVIYYEYRKQRDERDRMELLRHVGGVDGTKCTNKHLVKFVELKREYADFAVNLMPYLEHYQEAQILYCKQLLAERLNWASLSLGEAPAWPAQQLKQYCYGQAASHLPLHIQVNIDQTLAEGSVNFLHAFGGLYQQEIGIGSFRDLFRAYIKQVCKPVEREIGPSLRFYDQWSEQVPSLNAQVQEYLGSARVCETVLAETKMRKSPLVQLAFEFWSNNKHLFPSPSKRLKAHRSMRSLTYEPAEDSAGGSTSAAAAAAAADIDAPIEQEGGDVQGEPNERGMRKSGGFLSALRKGKLFRRRQT